MVFADISDAISAINAVLKAEILANSDQHGEQLVLLGNEAEERIYRVAYVDGLLRALAVVEENTQPDDYS